MGSRGLRRAATTMVAGSAALWLGAGAALAATGFTADQSVTGITGLSADTTQQVYWTAAKDSGTVTALASDGSVKGTLTYGATPKDVEAVSYRDGKLWIGDVGDADASRTSVTAYRISSFTFDANAAYRSFVLTYPDGAHDAHALVASPRGRLYVVTRGDKPGIYRTSTTLTPGGPANKLVRVADAPDNVTDATFSTDGNSLVLRTLTSVHVFDAYTFKEKAAAELPAADQGEAITIALDGKGLLVTGSATPTPVDPVDVPTTLASVSPAPATPQASPSASASPSVASVASAKPSTSNRGTLLSLVAAGVIALLAAAVVAFKR